jgi:hypothetical protein
MEYTGNSRITASSFLEREDSVATDVPEPSEEPTSPTDLMRAQEMLDSRMDFDCQLQGTPGRFLREGAVEISQNTMKRENADRLIKSLLDGYTEHDLRVSVSKEWLNSL